MDEPQREHQPVLVEPVLRLIAARPGEVVLDGTVRPQAAIDRCLMIAGAVEGVAKVVSKIVVIEYADYAGF